MESEYKSTIEDLEDNIGRLKHEINIMEFEKNQIEIDMTHDDQNKSSYMAEIDSLHEKIRSGDELRDKLEQLNKEQQKELRNLIAELEKQNENYKEKLAKVEKEINNFKENKEKRSKEIKVLKAKLIQKEDIALIKLKVESIEKEKEFCKKNFDESKNNLDMLKNVYKKTLEKMKLLNENYSKEIKKFEKKLLASEKNFENEKNKVIILTERLRKAGETTSSAHRQSIDISGLSFLSDILEKDESENKFEAKIIQLQNENTQLSLKLNELTNKTIEVFKKENNSLKLTVKEVQQMYELQIKELQNKTVSVNAEFQSFRRTTRKMSLKCGEVDCLSNNLQITNDLDNRIKDLKTEIKYLNEKIEILKKDVEFQKKLREKDVKFLKEELKNSDQWAVNAKVTLAQVVFEKDDELMKLRTINRKLKNKLISMQGNVSQTKSISFFC